MPKLTIDVSRRTIFLDGRKAAWWENRAKSSRSRKWYTNSRKYCHLVDLDGSHDTEKTSIDEIADLERQRGGEPFDWEPAAHRVRASSTLEVFNKFADHVESEFREREAKIRAAQPKPPIEIRRFPRLVKQTNPIKKFDDIPLTTSFPKQQIPWIVEMLIPSSQLILIAGLPASYKSFLVEALAAAVSKGHAFLGQPTKITTVLLLDRDNPLQIVRERLKIFGIEEGDRFRIWGNWAGDVPPMLNDPRLRKMAKNQRLLIIFDSFVRFHSADENSAKEMAVVMAKLRKLVTAGATVIVLHHSPKQKNNGRSGEKGKPSYRGSSDIFAGVDVAFNLSVERKSGPPILTLECVKHRSIEEFVLKLRPDLEHGKFELISDSTVQESAKFIEKLKAEISKSPGLCQADVIQRSGLQGEKKLSKILKEGNKIHWRIEHAERKKMLYFPL